MSAQPHSGNELFSIGEVINRLRDEFPELTVTKVRFLEQEGLVEPLRTPSGYRKFRGEHVDRIRFILQAQRDHYMPLKVIRERLDDMDRGVPAAVEEPASGSSPVRAVSLVSVDLTPTADDLVSAGSDVRMTRKQFLAAANIEAAFLEELESHQLVVPRVGTGYYDADALNIATVAAELAGWGIEPRHLRSMRLAAEREVELVKQVVTPQARGRVSGAAEESARTVTALMLRCHVATVRAGLARALGV